MAMFFSLCSRQLIFNQMAKDASFQMLIDMCNKVGWDKGLQILEKNVYANENMQASLFAGEPNQIRQAQKLSQTIIQQNMTIARLKKYRSEYSL
jgi:hypothetical protein